MQAPVGSCFPIACRPCGLNFDVPDFEQRIMPRTEYGETQVSVPKTEANLGHHADCGWVGLRMYDVSPNRGDERMATQTQAPPAHVGILKLGGRGESPIVHRGGVVTGGVVVQLRVAVEKLHPRNSPK